MCHLGSGPLNIPDFGAPNLLPPCKVTKRKIIWVLIEGAIRLLNLEMRQSNAVCTSTDLEAK